MDIKGLVGDKADSFLSKKLMALLGTGAMGPGLIESLTKVGVSGDVALYAIIGLAAVYIIVQGIVDYRREGMRGLQEGIKRLTNDLGKSEARTN